MMITKYLLLILLWTTASYAWIQESEPNDAMWQADPAQCGDTVRCGFLSWVGDADNFRFQGIAGDSVRLLTFDCDGGETNTFMILYDENDSVLAVNDNGGPMYYSQIRYAFSHTADYVVRVMRGGPSPDSTYNLLIDCPHPAPEDYDLCQTARVIPALPYYDEGSTQGATNQAGTAAPDVFYTFNNPIESNYTITVCSDLFDSRVQILGYCIGDYWDDASEGCNLGAVLNTYNLAPGQYWIMVEGTAANQIGDFSFEMTGQLPPCPPPDSVTLSTVGGYPFLDWPEVNGPAYFVVWSCNSVTGDYEHLGTTFTTYFVDSTGYVNTRRFYEVTSVCLW
jgi:hypothetical protein